MENVYKTPEAPLVETRGAKRAHFFVTSLGKMSVLFLVTLGLYGVYWMYKHWKAQQPQMERRISPVWRAIFGIFFFHALARRIHQALPEERQALWSPSKDATWAVLLTVAANLISHLTDVVPALEPYSLPSLLLLLTPLIPMRNTSARPTSPAATRRARATPAIRATTCCSSCSARSTGC
ncbi:TPA: hypothetical protein ACMFT5_006744 [Pseudomonas aeruginosa]|nr:DUF4234 domain-containing protein [Pseudomonas aeruginosa]HCF6632734.1 DUF4234 domain-containing protein [Pseudomonas aeruginosa]HCK0568988.1 DUF4234 domain-containing protein [Pseudomonas aeruginosa]HCK0574336.1 DUF4234 domain-containing protein [Pseudomonas aeruginosa]